MLGDPRCSVVSQVATFGQGEKSIVLPQYANFAIRILSALTVQVGENSPRLVNWLTLLQPSGLGHPLLGVRLWSVRVENRFSNSTNP
jgi:hypothetical protein